MVTLFINLQQAPKDMPSFAIHKARIREADQETPGAVTWRQRGRLLALHGDTDVDVWRAFVGGLCPGNSSPALNLTVVKVLMMNFCLAGVTQVFNHSFCQI